MSLAADDANDARESTGWGDSYIFSLALQTVEDGLVGRIREAGAVPGRLVVLKSAAHPLWSGDSIRRHFRTRSSTLAPIVKGIPERFVNTGQVFSGHKHLVAVSCGYQEDPDKRALSKAVLHALGWVVQKMGFPAMMLEALCHRRGQCYKPRRL